MSITLCTVLIGIDKSLMQTQDQKAVSTIVPIWMPILVGILVPIIMSVNAIIGKHLVSERIGFHPTKMALTSIGSYNLILFVVSLVLWFGTKSIKFDFEMFIIGFIGSFVVSIGIVLLQNAFKEGPAGPVSGIIAMASPL